MFKQGKTARFSKGDNPWSLSKHQTFFSFTFFGGKQVCKDHFLIFWIEKNDFKTRKLKF